MPMATPFHGRYLSLVEQMERDFPVAAWRSGDLDLWPVVRMDLYLDMYRANVGGARGAVRPFPIRTLAFAVTLLKNLVRSRKDLRHWVLRPKPADIIFLGDGVSLDCIDGEWHDRYGEPLMSAFEKQGLSTFLMQAGDLSRLPWHRSTFAANLIASRGQRSSFAAAELPRHDALLEFLRANDVLAPSLERRALQQRASTLSSTAAAFQRVLRIVKPKVGFVVTYYSDLGPAFVLACRREGILSVDLQHCPQEGAHKAYGWATLPKDGYATLPGLFWNWTARDAAHIARWADKLARPWHRSLYGGHTQLASFLDDEHPRARSWDAKFGALAGAATFQHEILIALQPVGGYRAQWNALAEQIRAAPTTWRWWIRRHPAARAYQDVEYQELISLRLPNVIINSCAALPLPALLRHMSALVSRFSGASAEAAMFGVPALFLSEEARGQFSAIIDRGEARIIEIAALNSVIAQLPKKPQRPARPRAPDLDSSLRQVLSLAKEYASLSA
jgi:hypothetical protein